MMAPMMQPLPRPVGKKRAEAEAAARAVHKVQAKRRATMWSLAVAAVLCGAALGALVWSALSVRGVPQPRPPAAGRNPASLVERDSRWFDDVKKGAGDERLKKHLEKNPRLKPGHQLVVAGRTAINLRTLVGPLGPEPEGRGKNAAPPPEEEGGGGVPSQPRLEGAESSGEGGLDLE